MSDIDYEPYPGSQPAVSTPASPQGQPWNRLAVWSFVIPVALLVVSWVVGQILVGVAQVDLDATAGLNMLVLTAVIGGIFEVGVQVYGVLLAHRSLRPEYRHLRGRGFGIAGLVLNYLGIFWSVLGLIFMVFIGAVL